MAPGRARNAAQKKEAAPKGGFRILEFQVVD
jgi:hypothetical protein